MFISKFFRNPHSRFGGLQCKSLSSNDWIGNTYYLSVFGKDRIGIVKDVSESIKQLDGNIEDSTMSILSNNFTITMKTFFPKNKERAYIFEELQKKLSPKNLDLYFYKNNDTYNGDNYKNSISYLITGSMHDDKGIIFELSNIFKKNGILIKKLETKKISAPIAGYPIFYFETQIQVFDITCFNTVNKNLQDLEKKYSGVIDVEKIDDINDD